MEVQKNFPKERWVTERDEKKIAIWNSNDSWGNSSKIDFFFITKEKLAKRINN